MNGRLKFSHLYQILEDLGFKKRVVAHSHVAFSHEETNTTLRYAIESPGELVPAAELIGTRKVLIDRGLVTETQLEAMLHPAAA